MQKKSQSSNFNLTMLNLWIGLCRGEKGLPTDIRRLGYKHQWIEFQFQNSLGESVKPELIIASDRLGHAVLLEWKEGANTVPTQLARYAHVKATDLVAQAMLNPSSASLHDVCIIGLQEHVDRLRIGIEKGGYLFPLLAVEEDGLTLRENQFVVDQLTSVFSKKLYVDFSMVPTFLIPFDHNSQRWQIAETAIPQIVAYMSRGETRFTLDQLVTDCAPVVRQYLSPAYLRQLSVKVHEVVDEARRNEFRYYFAPIKKSARKSSSPTWQITYNPQALLYDKRTAEFKKLERLSSVLIDALRTGKRRDYQLDLI